MAKAKIWERGQTIYFYCPACKTEHHMKLQENGGHKFNGNFDSPTFSPSVLWKCDFEGRIPTKVCHSFVKEGKIQFLNDCTHSLAGQTVDLPEIKGSTDADKTPRCGEGDGE